MKQTEPQRIREVALAGARLKIFADVALRSLFRMSVIFLAACFLALSVSGASLAGSLDLEFDTSFGEVPGERSGTVAHRRASMTMAAPGL